MNVGVRLLFFLLFKLSVLFTVIYALHAYISLVTLYFIRRMLNEYLMHCTSCNVGRKRTRLAHLKIRNINAYWIHFWWKFHLAQHKTLMPFQGWDSAWSETVVRASDCASALRWPGCRRRCSRASRTSETQRGRSPRWRRRRTNCWRSWTPPELDWGRPATCWLHCRSAHTHTHTFNYHTLWRTLHHIMQPKASHIPTITQRILIIT